MKYLVSLILFFMSLQIFGQSINIVGVAVTCTDSEICKFFKKNAHILRRNFERRDDFQSLLRIYYSKAGYDSFSFELEPTSGGYLLKIKLDPRNKILGIDFVIPDSEIKEGDLRAVLDLREDGFLDSRRLDNDKEKIERKLRLLGFPHSKVIYSVSRDPDIDGVNILFEVVPNDAQVLEKIEWSCQSNYAQSMAKKYFHGFIGKIFNKEEVIQEIKEFGTDLQNQGFYLSNTQFKISEVNNKVSVAIECGNTGRIVIDINDSNKFLTKDNIYTYLREYLKTTQRNFSENDLKRVIEDLFIRRGFEQPKVVLKSKTVTSENDKIIYVNVLIENSKRLKIESVGFKGVSFFTENELRDFFYDEGSDLVQSNYVDKDFYDVFNQKMVNKYVSSGFVNVSIKNYIGIASGNKRTLLFIVNEGSRAKIKRINISEVNKSEDNFEMVSILGLKEGEPFNPLVFSDQLKKLLDSLKEKGFYTAEIVNSGEDDMVRYTNGNREVTINITINKGDKKTVNDLIVYGVKKTKTSVVRRKLHYVYNSSLTPSLVKDVYSDLASLGVFRTYNVSFINAGKNLGDVDLVVEVEEKDYGAFELAPGFRTDLGIKLLARLSRSNVLGRNQTLALTAQSNYRVDLRDIEISRHEKKFVEYFGKINYIYPDFLKTYWDYYTSVSGSKKRFFNFDADIFRISNTMRKDIIDRYLSFSLTHQLEDIKQFNGTTADDNGEFRIGGLTPSIVLDLRDNSIIPRKGAHIQLSYELSKPSFGSQETDELKIDFYKLILRNRFYVPITDNLHIATSLSVGVQKNLADDVRRDSLGNVVFDGAEPDTTGFIPSIKVFRLSGVDTVRGFSEDEINLIDDSTDITDVKIRDKAFMTNFKLEPRYMFTDTMMLGVFFDAGSVQKDSYKPFENRTAAGFSFKYVTPVGTLDFDYGFKLQRKTKPDGSKETPGRIHVSIGFF